MTMAAHRASRGAIASEGLSAQVSSLAREAALFVGNGSQLNGLSPVPKKGNDHETDDHDRIGDSIDAFGQLRDGAEYGRRFYRGGLYGNAAGSHRQHHLVAWHHDRQFDDTKDWPRRGQPEL